MVEIKGKVHVPSQKCHKSMKNNDTKTKQTSNLEAMMQKTIRR
jgi:hypothetical protein